MASLFNYDQMHETAEQHSDDYLRGQPFPHIMLDNLANPQILEEAVGHFPSPEELRWFKYDNPFEKKLATNHIDQLPDVFRRIFLEFNSGGFVTFLEKLTGIEALIPDPHYNGGGLHQIERGGKLDVHADYNIHPKTKLDRRVNVLLYLNKDWDESYGGHLEFWPQDMSRAVQRILPVFNRMVVFSTTDTAYHGHPVPLSCPEYQSRKSFALYYYTNGRPVHEKSDTHSTLYKRRPEDPISEALEELRDKRAKGRLGDLTTVS